ncbi:hypothetical protein [Dolichospermum circinale]|nr:hypothetical protein [Dolichospermum circinale]MDB9463207.1 hypothetical protein [Dolichospermum circinale CS-541/04]
MTREQGTGNREQGTGFGQLYFSLLMSVFFPHLLTIRLTVFDKNKTYSTVTKNDHPLFVVRALALILYL